jgi:uncharacterized protein involved in exopolysaccharide biosynthesis
MESTPILYPRKFDQTEGPAVCWEVVPVVHQVPDIPFPTLHLDPPQEPVKLSPTLAIAGLTMALATGAIVYNQLGDEPEYQGELHLGIDPMLADPAATGSPAEPLNPSVIPPTVDLETQRLAVTSPRYLDPAIAQLQAQGIDLDYQSLSERLEVTITPEETLAITYRDHDPERTEAVLNALAEIYPVTSPACQDGACRSLQLVEAQIPELRQRISKLRAEIVQLHEQHGIPHLAEQVQMFDYRSREIAKQEATLQTQLAEVQARQVDLQQRLALEPEEAIAHQLLRQDPRYQQSFQKFQATERELATAMSRADTDAETLQALHTQHQALLADLTREAHQVLSRHLASPAAHHADPLWHEPLYLELLQQSVLTAHSLDVLTLRQHTINSIQQSLESQHDTLTRVLRRYDHLRQELQAQTRVLHEYLDRQQTYKEQVAETEFTWTVAQPPALLNLPAPEPMAPAPSPATASSRTATHTGIAAVLGLGVAIAVLRKHRHQTGASDDYKTGSGYDPDQDYTFSGGISHAFAR